MQNYTNFGEKNNQRLYLEVSESYKAGVTGHIRANIKFKACPFCNKL